MVTNNRESNVQEEPSPLLSKQFEENQKDAEKPAKASQEKSPTDVGHVNEGGNGLSRSVERSTGPPAASISLAAASAFCRSSPDVARPLFNPETTLNRLSFKDTTSSRLGVVLLPEDGDCGGGGSRTEPRPHFLLEQSFWCDGDLTKQNGGVLGRVVCLE
ncbi:hypothetical protein ACFX2B_040848 [Malus domestica]